MVVYGSSTDYVSLRSIEVIQEYRANGYEIRNLNPKSEMSVAEAFSVGLFDSNPVLVVVEEPTKLKGLKSYLENTQGCEVLVLYPKSSLPKLLEGFISHCLNEPKYEDKKLEWCANFVQEYALRHNKEISHEICMALVSRVGTNLGLLRYEVLKFVMLAGEEKTITAKMVAGVLADLIGPNSKELVDAILFRNPRSFLKLCSRIEKSSSTDQTMAVCNGLLFYNLRQLFDIAVRLQSGMSVAEISSDLNKNPWLVENKLKPQIERLGLKRIVKLIHALYESEDSVLKGSRNPWQNFKTRVIGIL